MGPRQSPTFAHSARSAPLWQVVKKMLKSFCLWNSFTPTDTHMTHPPLLVAASLHLLLRKPFQLLSGRNLNMDHQQWSGWNHPGELGEWHVEQSASIMFLLDSCRWLLESTQTETPTKKKKKLQGYDLYKTQPRGTYYFSTKSICCWWRKWAQNFHSVVKIILTNNSCISFEHLCLSNHLIRLHWWQTKSWIKQKHALLFTASLHAAELAA